MPLHRIYFDANERVFDYRNPEAQRFLLYLAPAVEELKRIGDELREGLRVLIYSPGEMEIEATLVFDTTYNAWTAKPIWETINYDPASLRLDSEDPADTTSTQE